MWEVAGIEGCFAGHGPVPVSLSSLLQFGTLHGSLVLPIGTSLVCFVTVDRLGDAERAADSPYSPDWLSLCLPLAALAKIDSLVGHYPHGFKEDQHPSVWTRPLDDWLAGIGIEIYATAKFRLGLVGYDAVMEDRSDTMANGIPPHRRLGYLWPDAGGICYHHANAGDWWRRHGSGAQLMKVRSAGAVALWRVRSTVHNHLNNLERRLEGWLSRMRE